MTTETSAWQEKTLDNADDAVNLAFLSLPLPHESRFTASALLERHSFCESTFIVLFQRMEINNCDMLKIPKMKFFS